MNKYASLSPAVVAILKDKHTEAPYSGEYNTVISHGTYICKGCGLALFRAHNQFASGCGWPSFDADIPNAILREPDADGRRTEILCARCHGHLGHVFSGEAKTPKNLRHCVNSLAIEFIKNDTILDTQEAIVAAGCFWGVQYYFDRLEGVVKTEVGYVGGHQPNPTYQEVCNHTTGHLEAVRVVYDPNIISYEKVMQYFFEIHDPEQTNGQGPDIGEQYLSAIFYFDQDQKKIAEHCIAYLMKKNVSVATQLFPMSVFWKGESSHQDYYQRHQQAPYCHRRVKRF